MLEAGTQVDGFKEFGFKKVRHAIPPFVLKSIGCIGTQEKRISVAATEILFCGNMKVSNFLYGAFGVKCYSTDKICPLISIRT